jgi:hypothetical protein
MVFLGSVWAGTALGPVPQAELPHTPAKASSVIPPASLAATGVAFGTDLEAGQLLAGAAKVSIEPAPDESQGQVWVRDKAKCTPLTSGDVQGTLDHVADWRLTWIENTNCIYMGGFGIGPSQPVLEWDQEYGLWTRSAAFVRDGKAVVLTILDGEGYFGAYNRMCGATPCGAHDLAAALAAETSLDPASFVFASTHAHSAMDFIGGWGGVPQWYMDQVALAMKTSVRRALGVEPCPANQDPAAPSCIALRAATLEGGEVLAHGMNGERRDSYHSAEDATLNWIRARTADETAATISTVATYAAHATSFGSGATKAHADWPGEFDKTVENRFGGIGLVFEAGLGNMSARGNDHGSMGQALGALVPPQGTPVADPVVVSKREFWDQPITNLPLNTLGGAGFFDRKFGGPAALTVAKGGWPPTDPEDPGWLVPCTSAGATSVNVSVTAARIGTVWITAAPGEIFANYSNTLEERPGVTTLAIGQANDALGYMPQSFETDDTARQGGGFVGGGVFEYEDAYSIDRCFGDKALETTIKLLDEIG